LFNAILNL